MFFQALLYSLVSSSEKRSIFLLAFEVIIMLTSALQAYDLAPTSVSLQRRIARTLKKGRVVPFCLARQSVDLGLEPHSQLAMAQIDLKVCYELFYCQNPCI